MDHLSNYDHLAGVARFELTNAGIKIRCLTAWLYPNEILWGGRRESNPRPPGPQSGALTNWATPAINGAPEEIRTPDTRLRRPLLYPTELQAHDAHDIHPLAQLRKWSGWWELNPRDQLGRLGFYHWTTPAVRQRLYTLPKFLSEVKRFQGIFTFFSKIFLHFLYKDARFSHRPSDKISVRFLI